jgi:hypothetical protein
MLLRLAKIMPPPPRSAKQQLLPAIWHHLNPQLQTLKLHELSLTLWAAAKLGYSEPQLYNACLGLFLQQLDAAPARHVSNVMYAFAAAPQEVASQHEQQVLQQLLPAFVQLVQAGEANPQVRHALQAVTTSLVSHCVIHSYVYLWVGCLLVAVVMEMFADVLGQPYTVCLPAQVQSHILLLLV